MSAVAPAAAQAPATAHPASTAHAAGHDRFGFAGVLEGLSASQAKARPDVQNRAQSQASHQDRRPAPPDAPSELRTASIDAALSSHFAAPMNAPAGEAAGATADTGPRAEGAANQPAAETQGSTGKPDAPAVDEAARARLVAERTFILPATANAAIASSSDPTAGTRRTGAAVTKADLAGAYLGASPSAAPLAAISMSEAVRARLVAERTFIPPTTANAAIASSSDPTAGTSRTGAAVTKADLAGEYLGASPSAAPLASISMSRAPGATVAKQGASEPATFAELGILPLSSPDAAAAAPESRAYATRGLSSASLTPPDGGNDGLPVPIADAALTARTSSGAGRETKSSSAGGAADGQPIPRPPTTKTLAPAAKGGGGLAPTPGACAASQDPPLAAPTGSTDPDPRPNDWSGSASGGPTPSAQPGALSTGSPTALAPVHAPDAQAAPAAEAVPAPSAATARAAPAKSPVREIDLDLAPGGLEDVTMTMRLAGDRLSVVIRAASAQTAGAIEGAREAIAERLAAIGQPLGSLVIQQTGGADGTGKAADASGDDGGAQAQRRDSGDRRGGARRGSSDF